MRNDTPQGPEATDRKESAAGAGESPRVRPIPEDALPIVPVRNLVLFPGMIPPITLGRAMGIAAAQEGAQRAADWSGSGTRCARRSPCARGSALGRHGGRDTALHHRAGWQEILESFDVRVRLDRVLVLLAHRIEVLRLSRDIDKRTQKSLDDRQREFLLREQMRAIKKELGEDEENSAEVGELSKAIAAARCRRRRSSARARN